MSPAGDWGLLGAGHGAASPRGSAWGHRFGDMDGPWCHLVTLRSVVLAGLWVRRDGSCSAPAFGSRSSSWCHQNPSECPRSGLVPPSCTGNLFRAEFGDSPAPPGCTETVPVSPRAVTNPSFGHPPSPARLWGGAAGTPRGTRAPRSHSLLHPSLQDVPAVLCLGLFSNSLFLLCSHASRSCPPQEPGPPRPPLPKSYVPLESPPAVPPLPSESRLWPYPASPSWHQGGGEAKRGQVPNPAGQLPPPPPPPLRRMG